MMQELHLHPQYSSGALSQTVPANMRACKWYDGRRVWFGPVFD